jgi:hypothetical protein
MTAVMIAETGIQCFRIDGSSVPCSAILALVRRERYALSTIGLVQLAISRVDVTGYATAPGAGHLVR